MADEKDNDIFDGMPPETPGYTAPRRTTCLEMMNKDQDDESLQKYKAALLAKEVIPHDPDNPNQVIVESITIIPEGRDPIVLDPTVKNPRYKLVEGTSFTCKICYYVQHDIVCGLKLHNVVSKFKVPVRNEVQMIGSFGPQTACYEQTFPPEVTPQGLMSRGKYMATAKVMDDDKNIYCDFTYKFEIVKSV